MSSRPKPRRSQPARPAPRTRARRTAALIVLPVILFGAAALAVVYTKRDGEQQAAESRVAQAATPVHGYEVLREYPHDPDAFTQGLLYRDGFLFESTGQYGRSSLRRVELETGRVVQQRPVEPVYFAEGLTDWGSRLIQLTWQTNVGFVYDLKSFAPESTFRYPGEGWGLTRDDRRLIMSDGTPELRFLDPDTWKESGRLRVHDRDVPIEDLNELEFIDGHIYANVWGSDRIAIIDPQTGAVTAWVDLRGLLRPSLRTGREDVLNGIAYDAGRRRLLVTGKLWPRLFEIRVRSGSTR
jgi:glutamine cyclotransferase